MFKYISQILSSLTPAQRILGLIMILCSVTIITLGPSLINANTTNCEDLKIRVESQNTQIIELNKRVSDLNTSILQNQSECTNRLINKEKEIYDIISEMENELQKNNKPRNNYRLISQETDSIPTRTIETNETPNNKKVLKMIKKVKSKLCQETSK
jgi:cell division septum initiation protein DivIVA